MCNVLLMCIIFVVCVYLILRNMKRSIGFVSVFIVILILVCLCGFMFLIIDFRIIEVLEINFIFKEKLFYDI